MCSPTWETHIPSDMCSPTWETHIPCDMCSPTWETDIPSDMCSPTWETHIPSDMCFPTWETHIPSDMCSPTWETYIPSSPTSLQLLGSILFFFWQKERLKRSWLLWLPWAYKAYHIILSSSMDGIVWPEFIWIWGTTPHVGYACTLPVFPLLWEAFIWLFAFPQYQDFQITKC